MTLFVEPTGEWKATDVAATTQTSGVDRSAAVIDLDQARDPQRYGAKAATLAAARAAGHPVPPGVVVPTDVAAGDVQDASVAAHTWLAAERYAVRSSAVGEDGEQRSYAGLYETELDVAPGQLAGAIDRVRASGSAQQVMAYDGAHRRTAPIPVLVMPMAAHAAAGVAFGADPLTGDPDVVCISVARGRGDRVVEGRVTPTELRVDRGGVISAVGPAVVDTDTGRRIADLTRAVEPLVGGPADVEFAVGPAGDVTLLQARPITTLTHPDAVPEGSWELEQDHFAEPPSTLLITWYLPLERESFEHAMRVVGMPLKYVERRRIGGYVYGRAVPLGAPENASRTPPAWLLRILVRVHPELRRRERTARAHLRRGLAGLVADAEAELAARRAEPLPAVSDLTEATDADLVGRFRRFEASAREATIEHFVLSMAVVAQVLGTVAARVHDEHGVPLDQLFTALGSAGTRELEERLREVGRVIAGDDAAAARLADDDEPAAILADLADGGAPVGPAVRALLDRYARHRIGYDLASPSIGDHPDVLLAALRSPHGPSAGSGDGALSELAERYAVGERLRHDLSLAARAAGFRDASEGLMHDRVGGMAEVLGELAKRWTMRGLLPYDELVFELTFDELDAALDATGAGRTLELDGETLTRRRAARQAARRLVPSRRFGPPAPAAPDPSVFSPAMCQVARAIEWFTSHAFGTPPVATTEQADGVLVGVAASPGRARGAVRVVASSGGMSAVADGEVLVCRFTTPAWTPALRKAAAVVTEVGGPLSHAAIVSRELGVPAVVAIPQACARLADGTVVEVDGGAGTVTPLERDGDAA